jgi:prepilin-type N-terminal cleavage/methylation domain-containing protein
MNDTRQNVRLAGARALRGFTLVEALAALLLIAIVLPVVMRGVSVAARAASSARRNTEAASLAQSKLNELLATQEWKAGYLAGQFDSDDGDNAYDYSWSAEATRWSEQYVRQLAVSVTWTSGGAQQSVTLTTLVYEGKPEEQTTGGAGAAGGGAGTGGGTR